MKRVDLSLAAPDEGAHAMMVDLFVEDHHSGDTGVDVEGRAENGDATMHELWLEPFEEASDDDETMRLARDEADEDPDGQEIDYPSSSDDSGSSNGGGGGGGGRDEFGDGWRTLRDDDEEQDDDVDVYGYGRDEDDVRADDRSLYLDADGQADPEAPWNYWAK